MLRCLYCTKRGLSSLSRHYAQSKPCAIRAGYARAPSAPPVVDDVPVPEPLDAEPDLQPEVAEGLARLLVKHSCHYTAIKEMIVTTKATLSTVGSLILADVKRSSDSCDLDLTGRIESILEKRLAIFDGLDTAHKQLKYIKRHFGADGKGAYVEPTKLYLGERCRTFTDPEDGTIYTYHEKEAHAVTFDLVSEVQRVMTTSDVAHDAIIETSRRWRVGTKNLPRPTVIRDMTDGTNFLEHPLLLEPEDDDVLIVPLMMSGDAVESCNPIGVSRGDHKLVAVLASLLGLPPELRTRFEFIITAMVALEDDLKFFGTTLAFGGCDNNMEPVDGMEASVGAQLRRSSVPVPITVRGKQWRVKLVLITFTADFEAQGLFGFESTSSNAHKLCRLCDFDKSTGQAAYKVRTDFLATPGKRRQRPAQGGLDWCERSAAVVERQMAQLATIAPGQRVEFSKRTGVFSSTSPFHSKVLPGFNIVGMRPEDIMHMLAASGIALLDAGAVIHYFIKIRKKFTVAKLNTRLAHMKENSAESIDLPAFHPSIVESDDNGRAKNKLRLKAAQVHVFIRISEELLAPLLGEDVNDVVWRAWLEQVKYFKTMTASSFTLEDLKRLDAEIQEHQELYASTPGAHFLPKHHFARHVAKDILRNGPARLYWCFPFEGFYRRVKHWAEHSNRKSELMHIATMLSLQKAVELTERAKDGA